MSPRFAFGSSGSSGSKLSSSMSSMLFGISASSSSNPNWLMSMFRRSASSSSNFSRSHSASSPVLLSASLNARTCSSVRSSAMMHGTVFRPSFCAALSLVWPATITLFLSRIIGTLNPNSRIEAATASTAASLFLGLFSYGITSDSFFSMMFICSSFLFGVLFS